ncbi:MAG: type II secretion system ATPase GspE [Desulfobacteraceae bacterium]|nr:type II secretion system ATPase GspE [Desulfobacteraceae bacterium]
MSVEAFLEHLSRKTFVDDDALETIKDLYQHQGDNFSEALLSTKLVPEEAMLHALGATYAIPFKPELSPAASGTGFTEKVSIHFLKKFLLVPLKTENGRTVIAIHDPCDLQAVDDVAAILGLDDYSLVLSSKGEILSAINAMYNQSQDNVQQLVEDMEGNSSNIIMEIEKTADLLDDTSDAPVIRLVNHIISRSVKANASDIHIEPFQESLKVRYRIDGILYELLTPPKWIQSALISRIKVMAKMNIAEKRAPQDGRLEVRIGEQKIDIRVSTVPTSFGERLVMRLLNKSGSLLELTEFGFSNKDLTLIKELISLNNGIVLVTGPTGSGKTTTLYAALSAINSPDKNIITIEDPVEYNLMGIGQIQVNRKTGVTFAAGLRSVVRQDPDVILVGEIRDLETAEIAIQSALTGHLVFSTLHTNDAAGAVTRLTDLGVEPYLITSSVKAVIAQRLVRVLCEDCKEAYCLSEAEMGYLNIRDRKSEQCNAFKAKGCPNCFDTGYTGRQAILEIMEVDEELKSMILTTSDSNQIKALALKHGMQTLRQNGVDKVLAGITTVEEVLRVTQE